MSPGFRAARATLPFALVALTAAVPAGRAPAPTMADIQVVGSHNSFKAPVPASVMRALRAHDAKLADALDYHHLPLKDQLDRGVRQLEIDIFADPKGGRYADPTGERIARAAGEATGFDRAAMLRPGYKVLHIPDVDYLSTCPTLASCLSGVAAWSRAHPRHLPIMITLNAADTPSTRPGIASPLPLDAPGLLDALDGEVRAALGTRLLTPDMVRGDAPTLARAVATRGWPALARARGRVYVLFDVRAAVSDAYRAGHPSLKGRAMFGWYPPGEAESAIQIVQDPVVDGRRIRDRVRAGTIVRTRSDADTIEARTRDHARALAAAASGAQAVSTDYYPGAPDPARLRFTVTLPGGAMARCNPVRASGCDARTLRE